MYHDQSCRCIQCAARPVLLKTHSDLTRTGEAAIKRFNKQTELLLDSNARDNIADIIARKLEDYMPYESASTISADLAQTIQSELFDSVEIVKKSAEVIIGSFVKSAPVIISKTILEYEKIENNITTTIS